MALLLALLFSTMEPPFVLFLIRSTKEASWTANTIDTTGVSWSYLTMMRLPFSQCTTQSMLTVSPPTCVLLHSLPWVQDAANRPRSSLQLVLARLTRDHLALWPSKAMADEFFQDAHTRPSRLPGETGLNIDDVRTTVLTDVHLHTPKNSSLPFCTNGDTANSHLVRDIDSAAPLSLEHLLHLTAIVFAKGCQAAVQHRAVARLSQADVLCLHSHRFNLRLVASSVALRCSLPEESAALSVLTALDAPYPSRRLCPSGRRSLRRDTLCRTHPRRPPRTAAPPVN